MYIRVFKLSLDNVQRLLTQYGYYNNTIPPSVPSLPGQAFNLCPDTKGLLESHFVPKRINHSVQGYNSSSIAWIWLSATQQRFNSGDILAPQFFLLLFWGRSSSKLCNNADEQWFVMHSLLHTKKAYCFKTLKIYKI